MRFFLVKKLRQWAEVMVYRPSPLLDAVEERVVFSCTGLRVEGSREDVVGHLKAAAEAYREAAQELENFPS